MTPSRLAEIKARCEAATEEPWLRRWTEDKKNYWVEASDGQQFIVAKPCNSEKLAEDAELIAHARQDLPDCVAEIERLTYQRNVFEIAVEATHEEIKRLKALVKTAHREGFAAIEGFAAYDADGELWKLSEARKALEAE